MGRNSTADRRGLGDRLGNSLGSEKAPNDTVMNIYSNRLRAEMDLQQLAGLWTNTFACIDTPISRLNNGNWVTGAEAHYFHDDSLVLRRRTCNLQLSTCNLPSVSYTRGTDLSGTMEGAGGIGGLVARSTYSGGTWTAHHFYFADGNGNITYMTDGSQALAAKYRYDPFGNTISSSGSLASANVYRFSSKEVHVASGMYYYGYRFYDPNLQRWLNRDPIQEWGGINLYGFVRNDPMTTVDLLGLQFVPSPGPGNCPPIVKIPPGPWPPPPVTNPPVTNPTTTRPPTNPPPSR